MKPTPVIFILLLITQTALSDNNRVGALIDQEITARQHDPNATVVSISQSMLESMNVKIEDQDLSTLLERLSHIKVLTVQSKGLSTFSFFEEVAYSIDTDFYEELMMVKTRERSFSIVAARSGETIQELLLIFQYGEDSGGMISLQGSLNESDVQTLRKQVDVDNLEEIPSIDGW